MLRHVAQTHRYRRRRPRYLPQVGLHLTAGVIDLQPELSTAGLANSLPALEFVPLQILFQHHAAGSGHGKAIDHHVARNDQPSTAVGPSLIKTHQVYRTRLVGVRHIFFHSGFGDAVLDGPTFG